MNLCQVPSERITRLFEGRLERKEAKSLKSHLLKCQHCQKVMLQKDPLLIFSLLSEQKKEEGFWNGFLEPIREKIAFRKKWFEWLGFMRPLPAAATLSSILLIAVLFLTLIFHQTLYGPGSAEVIPLEDYPGEEMCPTSPLPVVEGQLLPEANIVTVRIGETDIIMIFEENMDI